MEHALFIARLSAGALPSLEHGLLRSAAPILSTFCFGSQAQQIGAALSLGFAILAVAGLLIAVRVAVRRNTRALQTQLGQERALRESAEAANQAKAEFLASMSHEIEAPMNAILSFTDLALKTDLKDDSREYLDTVRTSAEWLMQLMNDVLEFSRIEAGRLQLHSARFSFAECIRSALKIAQPKAAAKGLTLRSKIDPRIPPAVCGDFTRFRQVILNLVDNAVKFTSSGSVMLSAALESESPEAVVVRLAVADTGTGIPADKQQHIFEPFRPLDTNTGRASGGTGLGLAISRKLVNLMSGKIEFQSQLGAGSTFEFTASFQKQQAGADVEPAGVGSCATVKHDAPPVDASLAEKVNDTPSLQSVTAQIGKVEAAAAPLAAAEGITVTETASATGTDPQAAEADPPKEQALEPTSAGAPESSLEDFALQAADDVRESEADMEALAAFLQSAGIWKENASTLPEVAVEGAGTADSPDDIAHFLRTDQLHESPVIQLEISGEQHLPESRDTASNEPQGTAVLVSDFDAVTTSSATWNDPSIRTNGEMGVPRALALLTAASQHTEEPLSATQDEGPKSVPARDPFEQARRWLSKSRFDIRVIHSDGDPSDRNLI